MTLARVIKIIPICNLKGIFSLKNVRAINEVATISKLPRRDAFPDVEIGLSSI